MGLGTGGGGEKRDGGGGVFLPALSAQKKQ